VPERKNQAEESAQECPKSCSHDRGGPTVEIRIATYGAKDSADARADNGPDRGVRTVTVLEAYFPHVLTVEDHFNRSFRNCAKQTSRYELAGHHISRGSHKCAFNSMLCTHGDQSTCPKVLYRVPISGLGLSGGCKKGYQHESNWNHSWLQHVNQSSGKNLCSDFACDTS
jgi:hypothetical protein